MISAGIVSQFSQQQKYSAHILSSQSLFVW